MRDAERAAQQLGQLAPAAAASLIRVDQDAAPTAPEAGDGGRHVRVGDPAHPASRPCGAPPDRRRCPRGSPPGARRPTRAAPATSSPSTRAPITMLTIGSAQSQPVVVMIGAATITPVEPDRSAKHVQEGRADVQAPRASPQDRAGDHVDRPATRATTSVAPPSAPGGSWRRRAASMRIPILDRHQRPAVDLRCEDLGPAHAEAHAAGGGPLARGRRAHLDQAQPRSPAAGPRTSSMRSPSTIRAEAASVRPARCITARSPAWGRGRRGRRRAERPPHAAAGGASGRAR